MEKRLRFFAFGLISLAISALTPARQPLTFEERVQAQEAIERVYHNHRIWPKENPGAKPSFEKMMSKAKIEAKVTEYLKKCNALEQFWQRPIEPKQLQAEMDRMAKGSKDPATLKEVFTALGNDPVLIAECLARPILADRLARNWYANDCRFHGETRKVAEDALVELVPGNFAQCHAGQYMKVTYRVEEPGDIPEPPDPEQNSNIIPVSQEIFERRVKESPPEGQISDIKETSEAFLIVHTLRLTDKELELETLTFAKRPLEDWIKIASLDPTLPVTSNSSTAFSAPPIPAATCSGGWENGSLDAMPEPRYAHTAVWTGTEMVIWGGQTGVYNNTGGKYNPITDTWTPTSTGAGCPNGRTGHTAVWTGTEMIIWGGGSVYYNSGGRYNPFSDSWLPTSTGLNCPIGRGYHTATWTGSEMIIWGGYANVYLNTGAKYDPNTDSWLPTSLGINVPCARSYHTAIWANDCMIIWGGAITASTSTNTGSRYYPSSDAWLPTSTGTNVPNAVGGHTAVWTGMDMLVWRGGYTWGRYSPSSDAWSTMSTINAPPYGRSSHTAVWTGTEMIVWGGTDNMDSNYATGGRYNPSNDSWNPTTTTNAPSGRYSHTAIWTGDEMIVWGGTTTSGYKFNTGGRYRPSSNSWIPTYSVANAPSGREYHSAVWTGSEMIVWGGDDSASYFVSSGAKYSPATDFWAATSGVNCPSTRSYHTAIWTGTEMVVWGGYHFTSSGSSYEYTGGIYNPWEDSWVSTSIAADCPAGRAYHPAIWTGTYMIVWGGRTGSSTYTNTGGRYDPLTDSWQATSTSANCPSQRTNHTAIWSGSEMIVWGGYNGGYPSTGGRYNPSTDTWRPTSLGANLPTARQDHTASWTGTEMVVWGGYNGIYYNTGGRYNPSSDSWAFTSTGADVPYGRRYHTALWTGTQMLIWGGYNGSYFNTGGLYSPASDTWTPTSTLGGCPTPRSNHTAVWTSSRMFVWGGSNGSYLASGGQYNPTAACSCTANAGSPQTVLVGQVAALNGSASSCTTGPPSAYLWTLISKPTGSTATITNATSAIASITPDLAGVYSVSLVVSNADGASTPATTSVTTSSCGAALSVYPSRPSAEPLEAVTFNAHGGSGAYAWMLTQNNTGASLAPSGATCIYTAGTAQGTDILRITDSVCGTPLDVTVKVQSLPPQVTEAYFCPPTTNGATMITFYAKFSANVISAEYMKLPSGSWTVMSGSGKNWQATVTISNPTSERNESYAVRGVITGGSTRTAKEQETLFVTPGKPPILLVHGWTQLFPCTDSDECQKHFQLLAPRLASEGYDARVVPGIGSWVDASANATVLKNYINNEGLQGKTVVLLGYSYGGIIIREFLHLNPLYAENVKAVVTIDTPHTGTRIANLILALSTLRTPFRWVYGLNHVHDDYALPWLLPLGSPRIGLPSIGSHPDIDWYEVGSKRSGVLMSNPLFNPIFLDQVWDGHDEIVSIHSQQGFGAGASNYHNKTFVSSRSNWSLNHVLHNQVLQDDGGTEFDAFYSNTLGPVIEEIMDPALGFRESSIKPASLEAQAIPSATRDRATVNQGGTALVGSEVTIPATIESTLQGTFSVSLSDGTASVWLTDPSSTVVNPASADGDSIKYEYDSASGIEQHSYTLRAPVAGSWTVHILPAATDPGGLTYAVFAQNLSTLGMSVSATPPDLVLGDAVVVSASILKAASPETGAAVSATLTLPDGANAWLTLYDDGLHQDGSAADGVYANYYTTGSQSGPYLVTVNASGIDATLGAWQRTADTNFNVGRIAGSFTGEYAESAPDADSDGKYDSLNIAAGVNVVESGDYRVLGDLKDRAGNVCSSASGTFAANAPGSHTVALSFLGQEIFENSAIGPYTLTNLRLYQSGTTFSLSDRKTNAYTTTGSYPSWMNFESKDVPLFQFTKPVTDEVVLTSSYKIEWKTGDGFANAVISLYYDSTGSGFAGIPIAGAQRLRKDDPNKYFTWDMSALPEGKYFVYALIQDGSFSDAVYSGSLYKTLDTDGDGMPDSWETTYGLDINNALDSLLDADSDDLINLNEYLAGTNPTLPDTDSGGEKDGSEVFNGRDPLVGADDVVAVQVLSVSPSAGSAVGGELVQIRGVNFKAGASVDFGGAPGVSVQVMDGQNILVTTPAHVAGPADVSASNSGGGSGTLTGGFAFQDMPSLAGISPDTAASHGGTAITASGSGFSTPMRALFGSDEAASVTVNSPNSLSAVTPVLPVGPYDVTALNQRYQSSTLTAALSIVDIPPEEVAKLDVLNVGGITLTWTPVTKATDGFTIQPSQYTVYRSSTVPFLKDASHRLGITGGEVTSMVDLTAGPVQYYLVTASYQSAEGE